MQLTKVKTVIEPSTGSMKKVTAMAWSPNNQRFAVVTVDRVVMLFDEHGDRQDKFATKPGNKVDKDYLIRALAFSPDSSKLAIAQSDNMVFVYKLGLEWTEKKSIKHKFQQSSPVTCLTWPQAHPHEIVFGLADGKVKVGQLRTNKPATLYATDSYTVACCSSPDGKSIITGHLDGAIYRFCFDDAEGGTPYSKFAQHACPPYALAWGASVLAAGGDKRVVFYDSYGNERRTFDYGADESEVKDFTVAASNPSGQAIVVGNFNQFFTYSYSAAREEWDEEGAKKIPNYYSVTSLAWKPDGSRLSVGTLCGCVDVFDACIKRTRYNGSFEFTYVSPSQVIVKRISNGQRVVLKSVFECEINKINIYADDRYIIANTNETIICGDLETCKMSEVPWNSTGSEKYVFDNPNVCMIYSSGELTLVEYGCNEILSNCRTEHVKTTLVSVRINERPPKRTSFTADIPTMSTTYTSPRGGTGDVKTPDNKKIAYLLDQMTVRVSDLSTGYTTATINHSSKIDWLEMNARADLLLYRDKRRQLHLYNVHKQTSSTLLTYCNYVQWVPESDVVVAQNRGNLCIWYNIEAPEKVTIIPINGDVEDILRSDGKTEVRVDEGMNTVVYTLDEALIGFGSALEDGDLEKAMRVLEQQTRDISEMRPETETMWKQLSQEALIFGRLDVAERCHAAVGDVSMTRYLRKVNKTKLQVKKATGTSGNDHWLVRAKLAVLNRDFKEAERIYLDQGQADEAIEMYQILHQWGEAIRVGEQRNHPEADEMKRSYFEYLISSNQEAKAAEIREKEGDYIEAIDLYLRGGRPAKAVHVVNTYKKNYQSDLLERIATALSTSGMHDKAGSFYERMSQMDRALESYIKGNAFRNAVDLSRREFPGQVVKLEEAWGDWLVLNKNMDAAIGHYIEANVSKKAIEAALGARQWTKAGQLTDALGASDPESARPLYRRIAKHYHDTQQLDRAETFYLQAECEKEAIQMYTDAGLWESAHKLATRYMSSEEVSQLYTHQAQTLEAKGKYKEAERLLLTVDAVDKAISMYKRARKYDHMIRLVAAYRKDLLKDTHLHLAGQLEMEGSLKEAEEHFAQAGEWPSAVNMYTANDLWDEAIRVAKYHGGVAASRKVAYQWAKLLGGDAGAKLLTKLGLIEQAVDYALETGSFQEALELSKTSLPSRVPDVHLKHALYLEDEERFTEAEAAFLLATKPKEAIEMYIHQQDWNNAMRVAEQYDPASVSDVLVAQAKVSVQAKQFPNAEALYISAKKPEMALQMYQENSLWTEAIAFAKRYLPHKVNEVTRASQGGTIAPSYNPSATSTSMMNARSAVDAAKKFEDTKDFSKAIDCYLSISAEGDVSKEEADLMVVAYERVVKLVNKHEKESYADVVEQVAEKLQNIGRYNAAGDMYEEIARHKEAVDCYVLAKKWDKAQEVAQVAPAYKESVDRAYKSHMRSEKNSNELLKVGDYDAALSLQAERGDWNSLFQVLENGEAPSELGSKYAETMAASMIRDVEMGAVPIKDVDEVLVRLAQYGNSNFSLLCRLSQEVLGRRETDIQIINGESSDPSCYLTTLRNLREVLFNSIKTSTGGSRRNESKFSSDGDTLERLLTVSHMMLLHYLCSKSGSQEMATNLLVYIVKYAGDAFPCDKSFYMAGNACKEMEWTGKAFVFLNRYLDLTEGIDEGTLGDIDNSDFKDTDFPVPHQHPLPKFHYLEEESREEVREWILGAAMDSEVEQEPIDMEWLEEVRSQVAENMNHIVRRFDRGALPIEDYLVQRR